MYKLNTQKLKKMYSILFSVRGVFAKRVDFGFNTYFPKVIFNKLRYYLQYFLRVSFFVTRKIGG